MLRAPGKRESRLLGRLHPEMVVVAVRCRRRLLFFVAALLDLACWICSAERSMMVRSVVGTVWLMCEVSG